MSQYLIPILGAIPGLIAAIVAYLSKKSGIERKELSQNEHETMETQLELVLKRLNARESAELRAAKRRIAELEQQLAEARQGRIDLG